MEDLRGVNNRAGIDRLDGPEATEESVNQLSASPDKPIIQAPLITLRPYAPPIPK